MRLNRFTMILLAVFTLLAVALVPASTTVGGTSTVSTADQGILKVVTLDWESDTTGTVTKTLPGVTGFISQIVFDPGATAPSDDYDVTITDQNGVDICIGLGANRDTANTETILFDQKMSTVTTTAVNTTNAATPWTISVAGALTVNITNAGDSKLGKIRIFVRQAQ